MSVFPCSHCGWMPGHGCRCITDPIEVRRAQRAVTARHRESLRPDKPKRRAA